MRQNSKRLKSNTKTYRYSLPTKFSNINQLDFKHKSVDYRMNMRSGREGTIMLDSCKIYHIKCLTDTQKHGLKDY